MQPWRNTWSRELRDSLDFRECDLLDLDAMRHACQGIDYVLHQAAIASVLRSIADPLNSNRANVDGNLNLLVAARDAQVKRVVFPLPPPPCSAALPDTRARCSMVRSAPATSGIPLPTSPWQRNTWVIAPA